MLDLIFLAIAAAAGGGVDGGAGSTVTAGVEVAPPAIAVPADRAVTGGPSPAFLSPAKDKDSATADAKSDAADSAPATAFLAPVQDGIAATQAAPAFLAPAPDSRASAATPLFLAPRAEAAPSFLAPATAPVSAPALVAEPQTPTGRFTTATEVKPILNATRANWISVREYDGKDLLYVTHLWSWRCGLLEMRVGINGNPPEVWPLPQCREDQQSPAAILEGDGLPYAEFGLGSLALIEVQITYDDLSTDSAKFNRNGMLVP